MHMVPFAQRTRPWLAIPVILLVFMISAVSADIPFFDETDEYDFVGAVIIAPDDLHLPLQGEASNCPKTEGVFHSYRTDIATGTAFPWKGYSAEGWEHQTVSGCTAHFRYITNVWKDDPDYWYIHLDTPKGYVPVAAYSLNAYGKALDSQTVFYNSNDLPVGDYSFLFMVKRDLTAPTASFSQELSGSPPRVTVTFDAGKSTSTKGSISRYEWSFGDRTTGSGQIVKHTYLNVDANSTYRVTLTVTDDTDLQSSITQDAVLFPSSAHVRAPPAPDPTVIMAALNPQGRVNGHLVVPGTLPGGSKGLTEQTNEDSSRQVSIGEMIGSLPSTIMSVLNVFSSPQPETTGSGQDTSGTTGSLQVVEYRESSVPAPGTVDDGTVARPGVTAGDAGNPAPGNSAIPVQQAIVEVHMIETPTAAASPTLPPVLSMSIPATQIANQPEIASPVTRPCPAGSARCDGLCYNLLHDTSHCGSCNMTCPAGSECISGICNPQCSAGLTACSGTCVNLLTDSGNCGSCSHVCMSGAICSNGQCVAQMVTTKPTGIGGGPGKTHF